MCQKSRKLVQKTHLGPHVFWPVQYKIIISASVRLDIFCRIIMYRLDPVGFMNPFSGSVSVTSAFMFNFYYDADKHF